MSLRKLPVALCNFSRLRSKPIQLRDCKLIHATAAVQLSTRR